MLHKQLVAQEPDQLESPISPVWQNRGSPGTAVYLLILMVLSALSLNDLARNVNHYLQHNRITKTKLVSGDNGLPFMPNLTVYIEWTEKPKKNQSIQAIYETLFADLIAEGIDPTTVGRVAGCAGDRDDDVLTDNDLKIPTTCNDRLIDQYLENDAFPTMVSRTIDKLKSYLINEPKGTFQVTDGLRPHQLAITFPTAAHFAKLTLSAKPEMVYCMSVRGTDSLKTARWILVDTPFPYKEILSEATSFPTKVSIRVNTKGVVDVTGFETCNPNVGADERAVFECKLRSISKLCRCVPFRYRRLFDDLPTVAQNKVSARKSGGNFREIMKKLAAMKMAKMANVTRNAQFNETFSLLNNQTYDETFYEDYYDELDVSDCRISNGTSQTLHLLPNGTSAYVASNSSYNKTINKNECALNQSINDTNAKNQSTNLIRKLNFTALTNEPYSLPFCTKTLYEECLTEEVEEAIQKRCRFSKACVNVNPTYSVIENGYSTSCPQNTAVELTVECYASTYLVSQEQAQTSWSGLLAQIGGNLGLYLGLSAVSLLKFLSISYNACRNRRRRRNEQSLSDTERQMSNTYGVKSNSFTSVTDQPKIVHIHVL